jgi:hypothetical protein
MVRIFLVSVLRSLDLIDPCEKKNSGIRKMERSSARQLPELLRAIRVSRERGSGVSDERCSDHACEIAPARQLTPRVCSIPIKPSR